MLFSRSNNVYNRRQTVNSNGFGFGLGAGLFIGYRAGFLVRPYRSNYYDEHRNQQYNKREDGMLECAIADTTAYVKKVSFYQFLSPAFISN